MYSLLKTLLLLSLFATLLSCNKDDSMLAVALKPRQLIQTLDPRQIGYVNEFVLLENLTSRLVSVNEKGEKQLELASDIRKVSDLEFRFKIKSAKFSDGSNISLKDIKASFDRIMKNGSSHVAIKEFVNSIEIEDQELVFRLSRPSKAFLYYLSLPDLGILHSSQYAKENVLAQDFTISSGAYTYVEKNGSFSLIKNKYFSLVSNNFPSVINLVDPHANDVASMIINGDIDLGQIDFNSFFKHKDQLFSKKDIRFMGVPSDALTYIHYNKNSKIPFGPEARAWLSKVIIQHFAVPEEFRTIARKSVQYFPPESEAFLLPEEIKPSHVDKPLGFPNEIVIHTFTTAYNVTIKSLVEQLERIPTIKIKIVPDIEPKNYMKEYKNGSFDLFLTIMSTDFRMPVEAINFEYFSPDARFTDSTGKIKDLYQEYQQTFNPTDEKNLLKNISRQMIKDSEFIPLFHAAIPLFYNSSKISSEGLSHRFIMNFWRLKMN